MILQPPRQVRPTPAVSDPAVRPDDVGGAVAGISDSVGGRVDADNLKVKQTRNALKEGIH